MSVTRIALALLLLGLSFSVSAQVARVVSVQGTVALERAGSPPRIVGVGDALEQKDVLNVAQSSNSIVEFRDKTRVTLRPNTTFRLESYSDSGDQNLVLGLVKGGLRAVSGDIAKRSPTAMRVQTNTTILGVRGTDFDARICAGDCGAEENAKPVSRAARPIVARAVDVRGTVSAGQTKEAGRFVVAGAAIYAGETITTHPDAHAVLAFADETRVTLLETSALAIERFSFDRANPRANAAQMRLVSGNAHVWTGEIASTAPEAFQFKTAAGTITANALNVRAAEVPAPVVLADTVGWDRGSKARAMSDAQPAWAGLMAPAPGFIRTADTSSSPHTGFSTGSNGGELVIFAWNGSVFVQSGDRRIEVKQPSVLAIAIVGGQVTFLAGPPDFLKTALLRPDSFKIDPATFGDGTGAEDGLYVWVRVGLVELGDLQIPAGFAGVANKNGFRLLDSVPNFFRFDLTPPPGLQPGPFMLRIFRGPDGSTLNMCIAN